VSLSDRLRRLGKRCAASDEGWKPYESKLSPRVVELLDKVKRIRDGHPDPVVRKASVMDILGPEIKAAVREGAREYQATHESRQISGRCYVQRRPELGRR